MAIEEAGNYNSRRYAEEILRQIGYQRGIVGIVEIAYALDIERVEFASLANFEGALITQPERTDGAIVVNDQVPVERQRFTLAHELLHFLNDSHVQTTGQFSCRKTDLGLTEKRPTENRHHRQEREANTFAIELLAPRSVVQKHLKNRPDLEIVRLLSADLQVSREAIARRMTQLFPEPVAIVTGRNGRVRYTCTHEDMPQLSVITGQTLPEAPSPKGDRKTSRLELVDPEDWLTRPRDYDLRAQTLIQSSGFSMTLLWPTPNRGVEENVEAEDSFDRLTSWDR